jgi:hypothetical protein
MLFDGFRGLCALFWGEKDPWVGQQFNPKGQGLLGCVVFGLHVAELGLCLGSQDNPTAGVVEADLIPSP